MKKFSNVLVGTAVVCAAVLVFPATASAAPGGKVQGTPDRAVATEKYRSVEGLLDTPVGWNGSLEGCQAGSTSQANKNASLMMLNYVRSLAGLRPVSLDKKYSKFAQDAALIMAANGYLTHFPVKSALCYSKSGYRGASKSNISLGGGFDDYQFSTSTGSRSVIRYMDDDGVNNIEVGHRRWFMYPALKKVGFGDTNTSNATYVVGDFRRNAKSKWVAWPTAGYFPREIEPEGRWSLSYANAVFTKATVQVTTPTDSFTIKPKSGSFDETHQARVVSTSGTRANYGDNTIVWDWTLPEWFTDDPQAEMPVTVKVSGIRVNGKKVTKQWTTTLFPASAQATANPSNP